MTSEPRRKDYGPSFRLSVSGVAMAAGVHLMARHGLLIRRSYTEKPTVKDVPFEATKKPLFIRRTVRAQSSKKQKFFASFFQKRSAFLSALLELFRRDWNDKTILRTLMAFVLARILSSLRKRPMARMLSPPTSQHSHGLEACSVGWRRRCLPNQRFMGFSGAQRSTLTRCFLKDICFVMVQCDRLCLTTS